MTFKVAVFLVLFFLTFRLCVLGIPYLNASNSGDVWKGVELIFLAGLCWSIWLFSLFWRKR